MSRYVLWMAAAVLGVGSAAEQAEFRVQPADKYPAKQAQGDITVAVKPYTSHQETREAFGKANPYKFGFVPVLVVITNAGQNTFGLEDLTVRFITSDREGLEPYSPEDLKYFHPRGTQPKKRPPLSPVPGVGGIGRARKGPLAKFEIEERAFKAPVLTPETSVSGFFYYKAGNEPNPVPGAAIYLSGIRNLTTGKELFYFEIPLDK